MMMMPDDLLSCIGMDCPQRLFYALGVEKRFYALGVVPKLDFPLFPTFSDFSPKVGIFHKFQKLSATSHHIF
jgi:hypothetical protein